MTRTRIVKGRIVKITEGAHSMYAEESIVEHAAATNTETGESAGTSFNTPGRPPLPEIKAKCMVQFRPHDTWTGDYGFDWLRSGDTGLKGDAWFGNIMGKYYEADNTTVFANTNKWNNNFRKEMSMYNTKLNSYKSLAIPWKQVGRKPYIYTIPTLTLLKGKSATLNLKIEIKEVPKKLTLEFKDKDASKYYSLNLTNIGDIKKGKYDKHNYIKITCNQESPVEQLIYVKADGDICGALRIHPNSAAFQKRIDVVFIKVKTNANGTDVIGRPVAGGTAFFKQCYNQALVIPNVVEEPTSLNCKEGLIPFLGFKYKFCTHNGTKYIVTKDNGLKEYLEDKLKSQFGDKYKGYYTVFFIGESGAWNGFSYFNSKFGVYFASHNQGTLAHETMHAMNLPHTFDGKSPQAKFTYQAMMSNNLMDYSHLATPPISRNCLYLWQWKILNPTIKPK